MRLRFFLHHNNILKRVLNLLLLIGAKEIKLLDLNPQFNSVQFLSKELVVGHKKSSHTK